MALYISPVVYVSGPISILGADEVRAMISEYSSREAKTLARFGHDSVRSYDEGSTGIAPGTPYSTHSLGFVASTDMSAHHKL